MTIWAIIPVKALARAKSRLAGLISPAERAALSRRLLAHTLSALAQAAAIERRLVVSRDRAVLGLAQRRGAQPVPETADRGLNAALEQGVRLARASGARAVLILPADLPHLGPADVAALLSPGDDPAVVIAPDRHERGTNALFVRPPGLIACAFGDDSFQTHLALARAAGVEPRLCRRPGVALDLDTPEDLALSQIEPAALKLAP